MVQNPNIPKPKKRTEEQKVFQEPIKVILGGQEYEIKPLVIKYSRPWRKKVVDLVATLPKYAQATTNKPEEFEQAIKLLMVESQDAIIDLFFEYAKELDQGKIEEMATEAEIAIAFEVVIDLAFPLSETLPILLEGREKPPRSGKG